MQVREVSIQYKTTNLPTVKVTAAEHLVELIRATLPDNVREHFLVFHLDSANKVISSRVVSTGTSDATYAMPIDVFQAAVMLGANRMIIAHNHPSGEVEPSKADLDITKRLQEAAKILGIKILDHIIVSDDKFLSFQFEGLI